MFILILIVLAVVFASNVKATVTVPTEEIVFKRSGGGAYSAEPVVQQIPTLGNTLPGSPTYGPDADPSDPRYWFSHSLQLEEEGVE